MYDISQKVAFLMVGFPGSGKSTLAKKIAVHFNCHYLSSDEMREKLFESTRYDNQGDDAVVKLRDQVYPKLYEAACNLLGKNQKVVVDASHMEKHMRALALDHLLKTSQKGSVCFVKVNPPLSEIEQRLESYKQVTNHNSHTESLFDGWKRVWGYFKEREKKGLISWPDETSGIDVISYQKIYETLDTQS